MGGVDQIRVKMSMYGVKAVRKLTKGTRELNQKTLARVG
jgi:hypothetical protein